MVCSLDNYHIEVLGAQLERLPYLLVYSAYVKRFKRKMDVDAIMVGARSRPRNGTGIAELSPHVDDSCTSSTSLQRLLSTSQTNNASLRAVQCPIVAASKPVACRKPPLSPTTRPITMDAPQQGSLSWRLSSHPITLLCFLGFRLCKHSTSLFPCPPSNH